MHGKRAERTMSFEATTSLTSATDLELARRYAPVIRFDAREPFLPTSVGYTVFRAAAPSPSFPRYVLLEPPISLVIEYALWWDWDIQHLYELEHAWIFVDQTGQITSVETSQHGAATCSAFGCEDERPILYAEPGKHALTCDRNQLMARRERTVRSCGPRAGMGGVWVTPLYQRRITSKTPDADQLARTYLRRLAFNPAWDWSQRIDVAALPLMPWPLLYTAIPGIIASRLNQLEASIPRSERHVLHIGHRGAGTLAPENTLAAINKAAELGAHMVELDVRMSADGVAVLAHDATVNLDRARVVPINELSAAELAHVAADYESSVPTLADALDRCELVGLSPYLELKEDAAVEPVVEQLSGRDLARYSVIGAFNPAWVARTTDRAPHIPTAILFASNDVDPVHLARACGARYVHPCWERHPAPHTLLTEKWLAAVRGAGLGVVCWHEERPAVLDALLRLGVSGICTDQLDRLQSAADNR